MVTSGRASAALLSAALLIPAPLVAQDKEEPELIEVKLDEALDGKIKDAIAQAQAGKLEDAINALDKLVELPNGGYLAAYNLGLVHELKGSRELAAKAYAKALQQEANFSPALRNLVRLYMRDRKLDEARKIAQRYVESRPRNLAHRTVELEVLVAQGRYEDVSLKARDILRRDELNVDAMLVLADANYALGRHELTKLILEKAQSLEPARADIYYKFGLVELKLENKPGAIANFKKAIELRPSYVEANNNLGLLYHEARDYEAALRHFKASVQHGPLFEQGFLNLGNAHKGLRQYGEAERAFKKAIELNPEYAPGHFNLAVLYLDSDVPGIEKVPRLQRSLEVFAQYKNVVKGKLPKDDPSDKYMAEAKKAITDEKARQELLRQTPKDED